MDEFAARHVLSYVRYGSRSLLAFEDNYGCPVLSVVRAQPVRGDEPGGLLHSRYYVRRKQGLRLARPFRVDRGVQENSVYGFLLDSGSFRLPTTPSHASRVGPGTRSTGYSGQKLPFWVIGG